MSNTLYMTPASESAQLKTKRKTASSFIMATMAALILILSTVGGISVSKGQQEAEAFDIDKWVMCSLITDEAAGMIYQNTQTADIPFLLRSKSVISSGTDRVDKGLNWLLEVSGHDFKTINENVLGYTFDPIGIEEALTDEQYKERYNKGQYVNPFDRFGVAGLKYSAYMGGWKYFLVDACKDSGEPTDPQAGLFYEERLEPKSTWEDIGNSKDPRTEQFSKNIASQFSLSASNIIANGIFSITKTVVTLTLAFINFSFADITSIMGLNDLIGSEGGVFDSLFSGVFAPLVFLMFILTAGHIFFSGIVKRQYRSALTALIRSLLLFVIAIVVAAAPAFFISLPNNAAVVIQSLILTSMNESITGGDQLCATDAGQISSKLVKNENAKDDDILEQASKNIRSVVGCQFWQSFLLKPWAEGQFGTDWNKLWANDSIPSWAKNAETLNNSNEEMVGNAEVPLGGGKSINNWAIYHISTQTNAHSPTGLEGQRSKYTTSVANDWWRIVDAFSNYEEEPFIDNLGGGMTVEYDVVKENAVTDHWDKWTGNSIMSRVGVSITSIVIAGVGLLAPLVFSAMSLMYTVGLAILMAFAPIMLLLGCWATKGWEIFKGWGELVLNTVMKRIATGLMLTISILFTSAVLKMTDTLGWWQIFALLVILSILLIKTRKQIVDILASFKFASTNFAGTAGRVSDAAKKPMGAVKASGRFATSTAMGGIASKRIGQSFGTGALAGAKNEMRNITYRNRGLREFATAYETQKSEQGDDILKDNKTCATCGKVLDYQKEMNGTDIFHGGRNANGNLVCNECTLDGIDPDVQEVTFTRIDAKSRNKKKRLHNEQQRKMYDALQSKFKDKSVLNNRQSAKLVEEIQEGGIDDDGNVSALKREELLVQLMQGMKMDISGHKMLSSREKDSEGNEIENAALMAATPEIPLEIEPYVDKNCLDTAWTNKEYDYIIMTYIAGYVSWYNDMADGQFSQDLNAIFDEIQSDKIDTGTGRGKTEQQSDKAGTP